MNRDQALAAGKVIVTTGEGHVEVRDPEPQQRRRGRKRSRRRKAPVDPFVTTAKVDRPMLPEQKSTLAALSRDPFLTFDNQQAATMTRGEASRLIPVLRKLAKTRHKAHVHQLRELKNRT